MSTIQIKSARKLTEHVSSNQEQPVARKYAFRAPWYENLGIFRGIWYFPVFLLVFVDLDFATHEFDALKALRNGIFIMREGKS